MQRAYLVVFFCTHNTVVHAIVNENYAAAAIHVNSGDVLLDYHGNKRIYPASITKLMTLYLVFEALENGKMSMNDEVVISKVASSQYGRRIEFLNNYNVHVRDLILATAVVSANDAASALAEEVGGDIKDFVSTMNQRATDLGMLNTNFSNPTGLFNSQNYTTPHDLMILASALRNNFPAYYKLFSWPVFFYRGRAFNSTNKLVDSFKGVDGLKTGYTKSSGYNLLCSFEYRGQYIVAGVFGFDLGARRNSYMENLLEYSIKRILHKASSSSSGHVASLYEDFLLSRELGVDRFSERKYAIFFLGKLLYNNIAGSLFEKYRIDGSSGVYNFLSMIGVHQDLLSQCVAMLHPLPSMRQESGVR